MTIKEQKKALRLEREFAVSNLSKTYCLKADALIFEHVKGLKEYQVAKSVFCFVSRSIEIDTLPILNDILNSGKKLGVPKCLSKGVMAVYQIRSLDELELGSFGIMEPNKKCPLLLPEEIDFGIIPCLSADRKGGRLGYGAGYYDRYLQNTVLTKAVICRESILSSSIPVEAHDQKMDIIISENEVIYI